MEHNILINMLKIGQLLGDVKIDYIKENLSKLPIIFPESDMLRRTSISISTHDFLAGEISTILKGAIISEVYANHGNSAGYDSVTCTQNITRKLIEIDPVMAYNMLIWAKGFGFSNYMFESCFTTSEYYQGIVENSKNPNQVLNALYILKKREDESSFQSNYVLDPQRQITIEKRKDTEKAREQRDIQDMRTEQYPQFNNMLFNATMSERVKALANDTVHTYNYYPASLFQDVSDKDILLFSDTEKKNLSNMFDIKVDREWANFQKRLYVLGIITYRQLRTID